MMPSKYYLQIDLNVLRSDLIARHKRVFQFDDVVEWLGRNGFRLHRGARWLVSGSMISRIPSESISAVERISD